jgi:hypothetical protein
VSGRARPTRRTILRGAGVALALPWLESLAPRAARGQMAAPPQTFIAMTFPCGAAAFWKPKAPGSGDAWTLSPILEPLAPLKPYVNVLANVGNYGPFGGHVEPSNSNLAASLLTCTRAIASGPDNATNGISADQVVAQAWAGRTKLDSLQVGLSTLDSYTDGMPPSCSRSISWRSPTEPLFKVVDPQKIFDQIVGAGGLVPGTRDVLAAARRGKNKSVLDYVLGHATTVRSQVGRSDQPRIDAFLDSVRALETRVDAAAAAHACAVGQRPPQSFDVGMVPTDYNRDRHADLMIDLVVMALRCDVTRVVSFMFDDARSDFNYVFVPPRKFTADGSTPDPTGPPLGSLYGMNAMGETSSSYATANRWFIEKLTRFCTLLHGSSSGEGNMLDDATVWMGSEMHGPNHDGLDLPIVVVGKGGNHLRTNQFIDFAQTPRQTERLANLFFTFHREVLGLPVTSFGSGAPPRNPNIVSLPAADNAFGNGTTVISEILG